MKTFKNYTKLELQYLNPSQIYNNLLEEPEIRKYTEPVCKFELELNV
jgi:hypothetical protein